ncbi:MAG: hypothetical protein COT16_02365 [Elusimicrobia bacterium CG08_land_8_20_14_0_20_44_26]|nr:MAG: hypothetical protein COT16_02365 [Elusimicrobia bacterium CG08_land_8_20_14_0_20_44_26]
MLLLIDAGNTTVKFAVPSGKTLRIIKAVPTELFSSEEVGSLLKVFKVCVFCSVVPSVTKIIRDACRKRKIKMFQPTYKDIKDIKIKYKKPSRLGGDRLAALKGALGRFRPPFIVIDIGTAVTCEIVNVRREYLGGVIFPGIEMSMSALAEKTALLGRPRRRFRRIESAAGRNTAQCISRGVFNSIAGGIEKTVKDFIALHPRARILMTGIGLRHFRRRDFSFRFVKDEVLVFKGLLQFYKSCYN